MEFPRFSFHFLWAIFLFPLPILIQSCGGDDGPTEPVDQPPQVSVISPASGTVGLLQDFTITFNEAVNPATVNASTVTVTPMTGSLYLDYDEATRTLWLAPDSLFPASETITVSVSSGVTDMAGNGLVPFSASFSTGAMECANLGDRFEPNSLISTATEVALDEPVAGLSTCGEDIDYFRFTLTETKKVTARTYTTYADERATWNINWAREDGDYYSTKSTWSETGEEESFAHTFQPGTYWVEIFDSHEEDLVLFDLSLETGPPCADDVYEDNDFRDQAVEVQPGTMNLVGCYVDADWFSMPMVTGQTITVSMDPGDFTGSRQLHVREPGGSGDWESGREGPAVISLTATQDGLARFYTMVWSDEIPYQLTIEVIDP